MKKISEFLSENVQFLVVKISIYLNRHVFVMVCPYKVDIFLIILKNLSAQCGN